MSFLNFSGFCLNGSRQKHTLGNVSLGFPSKLPQQGGILNFGQTQQPLFMWSNLHFRWSNPYCVFFLGVNSTINLQASAAQRSIVWRNLPQTSSWRGASAAPARAWEAKKQDFGAARWVQIWRWFPCKDLQILLVWWVLLWYPFTCVWSDDQIMRRRIIAAKWLRGWRHHGFGHRMWHGFVQKTGDSGNGENFLGEWTSHGIFIWIFGVQKLVLHVSRPLTDGTPHHSLWTECALAPCCTPGCQHLHICWWILGRSPPDSFWPRRKQVQLPSGKHTKSYWKWPFIVSFPIKHCDFP